MTPHEERLVLEFHSKWGNRWSRIAGKLPGRTDNEIKNYWRTHMRKKAQEKKKAMFQSSSSSSSSNSLSTTNSSKGNTISEFAGSFVTPMTREVLKKTIVEEEQEDLRSKVYSMDEIWKDFELSTSHVKPPLTFLDGESYFSGEIIGSPAVWDVSSLWAANEKESMMFPPTMSDNLYSFYNQDIFEYL